MTKYGETSKMVLQPDRHYRFEGIDQKSSYLDMPANKVEVAENCDITSRGSLILRKGYTQALNTVWGGRSIRSAIMYKYGTTKKLLLHGGTELGFVADLEGGSAAVTQIETGLVDADTQRMTFAQDGSLMFYADGTNVRTYNGTSARQHGITAPTNAPTLAAVAGSNLTAGTIHYYRYTYYNSTTEAESYPSPLSAASTVAAGPNEAFTVTVTAGSATTADRINIYRTTANGRILFYVGYVAIATTTYADTSVTDTLLGDELEVNSLWDDKRLEDWGVPKYIHKGPDQRIYAAGFTKKNLLRRSKIRPNGVPRPESFPTNQRAYFGDDFNSIIGINSAGEFPVILCEHSIGRVESFGDLFLVREITGEYEPIGHHATFKMGKLLGIVCKNNVILTDGQTDKPIGDDIESHLSDMNLNYKAKVSAYNCTATKQIRIAIPKSSSSTEPNRVLVGDYSEFDDRGIIKWTTYDQGPDSATYPGMEVGCFVEFSGANDEPVSYFGNVKASGKIYKMDDGTNDDSSAIYWRVVGRWSHFDSPEFPKYIDRIEAIIKADGEDYDISSSYYADLGDDLATAYAFDMDSELEQWDAANWDAFDWPKTVAKPKRNFIHKEAKEIQPTFWCGQLDAEIELYGYTVFGEVLWENTTNEA
jgi:hypothetical protein